MDSVKFYMLRRGCCTEMNITLCLQHLALRILDGWKLAKDNGPDNQECFDCKEGHIKLKV